MTAYTITTTRYFDDTTYFTGGLVRTGGDTYTIDGGTLIIDTDVRYGAAATPTTGAINSVTISATTGGTFRIDASNTRLIPYNSGSGTVPAMGTTISQGGVTGRLCGVWSAINVAPTAAGGAMPTSGFIKVCRKAGGNFAAGALTGITATSTGADTVGWIEVTADEGASVALTIPRLGQWIVRGDWFEIGTTNGNRGQVFDLPSSGQSLWLPGVWIETAVAGVYEFWPALNPLTTSSSPVALGTGGWTTANQGTDARSRHVQALASQIRIGSDGTNNIGHLPPSGRRVRIPNVLLMTNTTVARGTNAFPTLIASRIELNTTGGGLVDVDHAIGHWYINISQAYTTRLHDCAFSDQMTLSEVSSPLDLNNCHLSTVNNNDAIGLQISNCYGGGNILNGTYGRAASIATGDNSCNVLTCIGITFNNCWFWQGTLRGASIPSLAITSSQQITVQNCIVTSGLSLSGVSASSVINTTSMDRQVGTTTSAVPMSACAVSSNSFDILIDGWSLFPGVANNHPYNSFISVSSSSNIRFRNFGSLTTPLNGGTVNIARVAVLEGGQNFNIEFKRCYIINLNFTPINNSVTVTGAPANSNSGMLVENFVTDTDISQSMLSLNTLCKGCRWGLSAAATAAVYGTHFADCFTSDTAGAISVIANEKTTSEPSASAYTVSGTPSFTSSGTVAMRTTGDTVIWETPYYIIGHTSFGVPTVLGTSTTNILFEFDIDNGAGFSGTWSNALLQRTGAGGSNGSTTVTMSDTTHVDVGDRVIGTNIGTNATVVSVNSATAITVSVANVGTVSGTLSFTRLPLTTITSHVTGFKLRLAARAIATASATAMQRFNFITVTNATAQQVQYPLDVVDASLEIVNLQPNSEIRVYRTSDDVEIAGIENSGTTFTYNYTWTGADIDVYIRIHHLNYQWLTYNVTLGEDGVSIPVVQITDRQYENV